MTAEQLEELLGVFERESSPKERMAATGKLHVLAPSLARRVICAENIVDLLDATAMAHPEMQAAVAAYREAAK